MKQLSVLITASVLLTGCTSATLVKHPYEVETTSQYAPESEKQSNGIGLVSYLAEGYSGVINARKEDAYKKAYQACEGEYEILRKENLESNPMYLSTLNSYTNMVTTQGYSSTYHYIAFSCLNDK